MKENTLRLLTFGGIGDVILTTPAIREWRQRYPDGRLSVYCTQALHREILQGNPRIDALRMWRKWDFLPEFAARWMRGTYVYPEYSRLLPTISYRVSASSIIAEMMDLTLRDTSPEIFLSHNELAVAKARLVGKGIPVAVHATGMCTPNKQWISGRFEELVLRCPEYCFIQLGTRNEPSLSGAVDMRGLSLRESFATLKCCAAFVGVDSGLGHAAAAFGTPSVVIWGPTSPMVFGHSNAYHLYAGLKCSPCVDILQAGLCPYDVECMAAISVGAVEKALRGKLDTRKESIAGGGGNHRLSRVGSGADIHYS